MFVKSDKLAIIQLYKMNNIYVYTLYILQTLIKSVIIKK